MKSKKKIFCIYISIIFVIIVNKYLFEKKCNILMVFPFSKQDGPGNFAFYINESIVEWNSLGYNKYCNISFLRSISIKHACNYLKNRNNYIWFQSSMFLFTNKLNYNNIIYGPNLSPIRYFQFPVNNTHETKWIKIIEKIRYYVVHHYRVANHMMKRTNSYYQKNKYITFPCCIKYSKPVSILRWHNRIYDFIIYKKFIDCNHSYEGNILSNELKKEYEVVILQYGKYSKKELINYSSNSKIVIYFSFYDTGAMALIEMQRMGIFSVTLQPELITHVNGIYLPELENNISIAIIKIKKIILRSYDSIYLSNYNRKMFDCKRYLNKIIKKL